MPRTSYQQIRDNDVSDVDLSLVRWDDEKVLDFFLTVLPANKSIKRLDLRHGSLNDEDFAIILEGIQSREVKLDLLNLDHNRFTAKIYDNFVKLIESNKVGAVYFYDYNNIFTHGQKDALGKIAKTNDVRLSFENSLDRPQSPSFFSDQTISVNSKNDEKKECNRPANCIVSISPSTSS